MAGDPDAYRRLFEDSADGVAVLADLVARFYRPQVTSGGIDAVLTTYERGGMRKVIDHIDTMINRAKGLPDVSGQEAQTDE